MAHINTNILIMAIIGIAVIASGCIDESDTTAIFKSPPEVLQLIKEHPDARIIVTFWSKEEIERSAEDIDQQCDKHINPIAMYKSTIYEKDLRIVSWINAENNNVICSTAGRDIVPSKTIPPSITPPTPAHTPASTPSYGIINGAFDEELNGWTRNISGNSDVTWDDGRARLRIYQCSYTSIKQDIIINKPILSFDWEVYHELCPERPTVQITVDGQVVYNYDAYGKYPPYCEFDVRYSGTEAINLSAYVGKVASIEFNIHGYPNYCSYGDHSNTYFWIDNVILKNSS